LFIRTEAKRSGGICSILVPLAIEKGLKRVCENPDLRDSKFFPQPVKPFGAAKGKGILQIPALRFGRDDKV
jgi:hypothetical protein